jgi:hypothetical protein
VYVFMSRRQTIKQNHTKVTNRSSENVAKFRYLGTTIPNRNCIREEIRGD